MDYSILKKQKTALYKHDTCRHVFHYPGVYQLLIVACIAADGITIFSLIDLFLKQSQAMSIVITIAVAGVLNIAAVLLASCIQNDAFTLLEKKVLSGLIIAVFTLFFTAVFALRVNSMEQLYGSNSTDLGIVVQEETMEQTGSDTEEEFEPTTGQVILAVILGLEPLGTSVLCFFVGYELSPERRRRYLEEIHEIEREEAIDHAKVMIEELKADMGFDLEAYDEAQWKNQIAIIIQQGELAKRAAIRKLTEHDGTPEGVSYLMEEEYLKKSNAESFDSAALPYKNDGVSEVKCIA